MFSLNPFSKNDHNRCTHLASNHRRCRNLIPSTSDDHLCRFHSDQAKAAQLAAQQEAEEAARVADLYGQISDLDSPLAVAKVLSNLFRLIAENRIHPKQASSLNATARIILRALKDHEIATRHATSNTDPSESSYEEDSVAASDSEVADESEQLVGAQLACPEPPRRAVPASCRANAESEISGSSLNEITPREGAAPCGSQGAGVDVDSQPARKSANKTKSPIATDAPQPCNTYKEALIATLRHSNMTQEEIDEYVKQHCDRLPYEPNSAKPKKPFIKFRPRRFRWSNSW